MLDHTGWSSYYAFMLSDLWNFFLAVLDEWVALMSGGIITVGVALWERYTKTNVSGKIYLGIIGFFVLLACFLAWRRQYFENQAGRDAGTLSLAGLNTELNQDGNILNPQITINLKNKQNRLVSYHVDEMYLKIGEKEMPQQPTLNNGGYIHPDDTSMFLYPKITAVPLDKPPLECILKYAITYNVVGSKIKHHTMKKVIFEIGSATGEGKFVILDQFED